MKVSRVAEMRELDRTAIEKFGIREELLMENAGLTAFTALQECFGVRGKKFIVFCGLGNNGGDGFVVSRKIHSNGGAVKVFVLGDRRKFRGAAALNLDILSRLPVEILDIDAPESIQPDLAHCDGIVDAIFGTGLAREVGGLYREVIDRINRSGKQVLSVDIPSGVQGDTGAVMGVAVRADVTVTFGLPKLGNVLFPGYELCGKLFVTHISFPPSLYDADSLRVEINDPLPLPPRDRTGHKGTFGDALFIAGAAAYFGAPYFAAQSFLRAGGGYARLAAPASMTPFLANKGSEIVFLPQKETRFGSLALENKARLLELADKTDMVVLGPGLSLVEETRQLARELAAEIGRPLILDGDGITALCGAPEILRARRPETILTPHPGEMSRMAHVPVPEIEAGRVDVLQRMSRALKATIVLKGAHSLVGYPDQRVFINMSGNSGMATAGSGDVLTGTIAAMHGLGLSLPEAVRKGVFVHGLAGDLAAEARGEDGITAQDILESLPLAVRADRKPGWTGP